MFLRNTFIYYLFIILPMIALIIGDRYGYISDTAFAILLLFYALVYHPLVSGFRLISLNKIKRSQLLYNLIPFWNLKYFGTLFRGK